MDVPGVLERWAHVTGRRLGSALAVAGLAAVVAGCGPLPSTPPTEPAVADGAATSSPSTSATADETGGTADVDSSRLLTDTATEQAVGAAAPSTALAALAVLEVKGRAPQTGYSRDRFGAAWADVDHNGCDTRNDILARDLTAETFKPGTRNCVVLTGVLADPYSGQTMQFLRGTTTSDNVQIDHVVALSDAWQKGAQGWDAERRVAFANDPLNLLAVQGRLNQQKGDGDAATWLPPNRGYRCAYVARQVAVKVSYGLWVTQAEKNAMASVLSTCPAEPLPGGVAATAPAPAPAPASAPAPAPAPAPSVVYKNCDDVRAHGAAPIHRGDPGWQDKFDRDHDGVGCES